MSGRALTYPYKTATPRRRQTVHAGVTPSHASSEFKTMAYLALAHIPLGILLYSAGILALLHPAAVFSFGIYWATQKRVGLERVAIVIAYLVGAEVLWRMAAVPVPWEFGKYGSAAIAVTALAIRHPIKVPQTPATYLVALFPSALLTFTVYKFDEARQISSFYLSGPLLLAICCVFFSNVRLKPTELRRILLALIVPLISVGSATLFFTVTVEDIQFNTESNFATSGGFGPNQVSIMLGLGLFTALACILCFRIDAKLKILLAVAAVFFAAQCTMTFSRGGMYTAVGACLVLLFFQFRDINSALRRVLPLVAIVFVFLWVVFPVLDNFTGGKLSDRFEDTGTSNRFELAQSDLNIFLEYPVTGAGVGLADEYRRQVTGYGAGNHTEFSRLISEHGAFGIVALVSLVSLAFGNFGRQRSTLGRAFVAGAAAWSAIFMLNTGMRLAAPGFLFGLTCITIVSPMRRMMVRRAALSARAAERANFEH